jgi:hypothetical protein
LDAENWDRPAVARAAAGPRPLAARTRASEQHWHFPLCLATGRGRVADVALDLNTSNPFGHMAATNELSIERVVMFTVSD